MIVKYVPIYANRSFYRKGSETCNWLWRNSCYIVECMTLHTLKVYRQAVIMCIGLAFDGRSWKEGTPFLYIHPFLSP